MKRLAELRAHSKLLALFVFLVLGLAVFSPALNGPFLPWDDREHLELNPLVTTQNYQDIWTQPYFGLYIPVTYSIWATIYKFTQSPSVFHISNLLLHVFSTWIVFLLILRTSREEWAPWIGAAVFLLHPLQVEPVAWISGGRDLLAAHFGLLVLYYIESKGSYVSYVIGLLSKPTLAVLPAAAFVFHRDRRLKLAAMFAIGIAVSVFTFWIQIPDLAGTGEQIAFWWHPVIALDSLGFYLGKLFTFNLSADYGRSPLNVIENRLYINTLPWVAVTAGLFTRVWRDSQIRKHAAFALIMLLPVLGLIPFQAQAQSTVADRYVYLSMFGVAAVAGELTRNRNFRIAITIALISFGFLSYQRARVWSSSESFFTAMYESNPRSYSAHVSLGMIALFKQEPDKAEMHLREAMKLRENGAEAAANLASLYWVSGRPQLILQDLEPKLRDSIYMERNRPATRAISMLYRLVARAEESQGLIDKARLDYCMYSAMDPQNAEGQGEVQQFLAKHQGSCSR